MSLSRTSAKPVTSIKITKDLSVGLFDDGKVMTMIHGVPFVQCRKMLIIAPDEEAIANKFRDYKNMDEFIAGRSDKEREMDMKTVLDPETELFGHASTIEGWVLSGYALDVIDSRIAFPILIALQNHDEAARNALYYEIERRWAEGNEASRTALLAKILSEQPDGSTIDPAFFLNFFGRMSKKYKELVLDLDVPVKIYDAILKRYPEMDSGIDIHDILGGNEILKRGSSCPFCMTLIDWDIETGLIKARYADINRILKVKKNTIYRGYYIGDVEVNEVADDFYDIDSFTDVERCPECGATRFSIDTGREDVPGFSYPRIGFEYLKDLSLETFNKFQHQGVPVEWDNPLLGKLTFLHADARTKEFRGFLYGLFSDYVEFMNWLNSTGNTSDFLRFVIEHELGKDTRLKKRTVRRKGKSFETITDESKIKAEIQWNEGEYAGFQRGDFIVISVKDKEIDIERILASYIETKKLSETRRESLLEKKPRRTTASKFYDLERFSGTSKSNQRRK